MAVLPKEEALPIREWASENLHHPTGDGLEAMPHVTVLFGFLPSVDIKEVAKVLKEEVGKIDLELGSIGRFENEKFDVIHVEVHSKDLTGLNGVLRKKFKERVEITHPNYVPHLTLGYVEKGTNKELNGHDKFVGNVYRLKEVMFSSAGSKIKTVIKLDEGFNQIARCLVQEVSFL
jgi:2'-5' RNA ligase